MKKNSKMVFLIAFSFVIGGIVTLSILKWTPLLSSLMTTSASTTTTSGTTANRTEVVEKSSIATAVEKTSPAVVMVDGFKNGEEASTGTGFVYKTDDKYGYVMTNQHVVADCDEIKLIMSDDSEVEAKVLGGDEYLDVAVLRIAKDKVLGVATIGTSENMKVGDMIFTIGSPMGKTYRGTVTSGILSGKDRMVTVSVSNSKSNDWVMKVLQIDAAINPGNSGGPLLNVNGEVIGINSMKLVQDEIEGMGFAIPIEIAMAHVDELQEGKEIQWPMLGISMINVSDKNIAASNGISVDSSIKSGVIVAKITEGSGAASSDLKVGDVITKINGEETDNTAYLRYELYKNAPGDTIEITYVRDKKEHTTKVKLSKSSS